MKQFILSLCFCIFSCGVFSQNDFFYEDFNNFSASPGWINSSGPGVTNWQFGYIGGAIQNSPGVYINMNGTSYAYFSDAALGPLGTNNTVSLTSPSFDNSSAGSTFLSFQYYFRNMPNRLDSFYVEVFNGVNWNTVYSQTVNVCAWYRGGARCPSGSYPIENIDISAFKSSSCKVRFTYHDDNGLAYYMGIDNIRVYTPISTSIEESEELQLLTISPNPSTGLFNLSVSSKLIGKQYQVFSLTGKLVQEARINLENSSLQLENVNKGIYFVKIEGLDKAERIVVL